MARVDVDLALLEIPVRPHRQVLVDRAVGLAHVEVVGEPEHLPERRDPRADGDDDLLDVDGAFVGVDSCCRPGAVEVESGDLDACFDASAGGAGLVGEAEHRLAVERVAAGVLVQADGQAGRAPVGVQAAHVRLDVLLADDQLGGVPDPLLALVHCDQILLLGGRSERDVAAAVVVEGLRVGLPHLDARRHQFLHGRLEVVVADHAAGDARRAGRDVGLVDDEDVGAVLGGVPGGREAVDSGADDEEGRGGGEGFGHVVRLCCSCPPVGGSGRCVLGNAIGVWARGIVIPLKEDVKVGVCGRADGSGLSDGFRGGARSNARVDRA